jgi:aspartate ammonia-lyase
MQTQLGGIGPTRTELDALGSVSVPFHALYGAQTERAVRNFPISGVTIGQLPDLIKALALIKKSAARANARLGHLSDEKAELISRVCDEIIAGQHRQHFPVDVFQGGAGTSTNMNINEVIANRALELLGRPCGEYALLHPNDDVNRSQSTNDVYPTAVRVALMSAVPNLTGSMEALARAFEERGKAFFGIYKLGRTELQDAVPMTLGAEMHAYAVTIQADVQQLQATVKLLEDVNLGGTAVGTGVAAPDQYREFALEELCKLSKLPLKPAADLLEANWDTGVFVHLSGVLKRVAIKLSKISNDLRLLSSGPRGGLGEIKLPAVQPGSSLMPGKVNPVIAEMVNQVSFQVIGTDVTISFAAESGQLQLNAFEPLIAFGLLQSISLLRNATDILRTRCVEGIEADEDRCRKNLEESMAGLTEMVPQIGYDRASQLAQQILKAGKNLRDVDIK